MASTQVEIELIARLDNVERELSKFVKSTNKSLGTISLGTAITAVNQGLELIQRTAGFVFNTFVSEALEAEQATQRLASTLRLTDDFSQEAVDSFQELASALQETTAVQDEAILQAAALAKNFELSNSESKAAVRAALDLSAATGKDLNTAVELVSRTTQGYVDRGLARVVPALKELTVEQLIAGEGIALVQKRFEGAAAAIADTTAGRIQKAKNAFSDLREEIGTLLLPALGQLAKAFSDLLKEARSTPIQIPIGQGGAFNQVATPSNLGQIRAADEAARQQAKAIREDADKEAKRQAERGAVQLRERQKQREQIERQLADFELGLQLENAQSVEKIRLEGAQKQRQLDLQLALANEQKVFVSKERQQKILADIQAGIDKKRIAEIARLQKQVAFDVGGEGVKALTGQESALDGLSGSEQTTAIAAGVTNAIAQGANGAEVFVTSALRAGANAAVPGLGDALAPVFQVLAKGPEETAKFVQSFVESLPQVILNIVQAAPKFVTELVKGIPTLIQGFLKGIPDIITGFVRAIPEIIANATALIPQLVVLFVTEFIAKIPEIVISFAEEFLKIPGRFVDALLDALGFGGDFGDFIDEIPIIGDIFASGGRVPDMQQYRGDRYPALLDAGEQVFSRDLTQRLERFLNGQGGGGGAQTVVIQVGESELARVLLDINRRGFRTA